MDPKKCIDCGKEAAGGLSIHNLCKECAYARQVKSTSQIKNKSGPYYEKWKAGLLRGVE